MNRGRTPNERAAIAIVAAMHDIRQSAWRVVSHPEVGVIYDWADPISGQVGQCCLAEPGRWRQAPGGVQPVVLVLG